MSQAGSQITCADLVRFPDALGLIASEPQWGVAAQRKLPSELSPGNGSEYYIFMLCDF